MINLAITVLLVITTSYTLFSNSQNNNNPNVILILTDDQGYGDIGRNGNPWVKTPHIDELMNSSINFTDYHVDPTCSPTRAALMTGKYSARTGVWMTYMGRHHLNKDETTMADVFSNNGYKTAIIGKWHLGDNYPFRPTDRGFRESVIHGSGVIGEVPDYWGNDYYNDVYVHNNKPEQYTGYCTDVWFTEAKNFVRLNKQAPFFLYLSLNAPHGPLNVPRKYVEPYLNNPDIPESRAWFYGMIANIDEHIGSFIQFLHTEGISENTIIIFMTDNGTVSGYCEHPKSGYNAGMRGIKGTPYEGGHRVACAFKWPAGGYKTFREIDELTAHIDILPTLIDMLQLQVEKSIQFDGISLMPLIDTTEHTSWPNRTLCVHNQISFGQKLKNDLPVKYKKYAVMNERWRLVNGNELYQIKSDPGQKNNIAGQYPDIVLQLHQQYENWWDDISVNFHQYNSTCIGSPEQEKVVLTAQFWHGNDVPYSQEHVRNGMIANGFWDIHVTKSGYYNFSLCRWPRESGLSMHSLLPKSVLDTTRIFKDFALYKLESNALEINSARLKVGEFDKTIPVSQNQYEAIFTVHLEEGQQFVNTWFTLNNGTKSGAYYVYVEPAKIEL